MPDLELPYLTLLLRDAPVVEYDGPVARARAEGAGEEHIEGLERARTLALRVRSTLREQKRRENELTALFETASDLAGLRDLDAVLRAIVLRARKLLGTDVAYLTLNDPDADDTYMRVTDGSISAKFQRVRLGMGKGSAARSRSWTRTAGCCPACWMPRSASRSKGPSRSRRRPGGPGASAGSGWPRSAPARTGRRRSCCGRAELEAADQRILERAAMVTALRLLTEHSVRAAEHRVRGELVADLLDAAERGEADRCLSALLALGRIGDAACRRDLGFAGLLLGANWNDPDRALEIQLALRLHRLL